MAKKKHTILSEFRTFIMRGNVLDLAVGVIIANAFGKITTSLVNDVFMPIIGCLIGNIDLAKLNITLIPQKVDEAGTVIKEAVNIGIGTWLVTVIDFLIVAFVVFLVVKGFNKAKAIGEKLKKQEEEKAEEEKAKEPPKPTTEELLTSILDEIKKNNEEK